MCPMLAPACATGIHVAFEKWMKPFNPILGETWQAQLPDGTRLDLEQISHHPPVSAFFLEGAGEWLCRTHPYKGCSFGKGGPLKGLQAHGAIPALHPDVLH